MAAIPKKIVERISAGLKKYQPLLLNAKSRDVGEADTVTLIKDMLSDIFGYDKYSEVTSEFSIRGTYCDLAIKLSNELATLIEAKAIGIELRDNHVKQAVDYAANQGIDWVVLTNGMHWQVYHILFEKPIDKELIVEFDISNLNAKSANNLEMIYLLCKEGWQKSALGEYRTQKQALSRFFIGAMLQSDVVVDLIRRELRRVTPGVKIESDEIRAVLTGEVIKRDVLEGDQAKDATKKIGKASSKSLRVSAPKKQSKEDGVVSINDPQIDGDNGQ